MGMVQYNSEEHEGEAKHCFCIGADKCKDKTCKLVRAYDNKILTYLVS